MIIDPRLDRLAESRNTGTLGPFSPAEPVRSFRFAHCVAGELYSADFADVICSQGRRYGKKRRSNRRAKLCYR